MYGNNKKRILVIGMIFILSIVMIFSHRIDTLAADTGTVTATSLYVRKGAGTNYDIVTSGGSKVSLVKGTKVTISKKVNNWYYISATFNKKTIKGYVLGDYIKLSTSTSSSNTNKDAIAASTTADLKIPGKVTATKLNVRKTASSTGTQLTVDKVKVSLSKNTKVTILKETTTKNQKWYYVSFKFNGATKKGYVLSDYIALTLSSSVKATVNSSSTVKIRTGAGDKKSYLKDANKKIVTLKSGKAITITKEVTAGGKKWFYVSFTYDGNKLKGYIEASKVLYKVTATTTDSGSSSSDGNSDNSSNGSQGNGSGSSGSNTNSNIVIGSDKVSVEGKVTGTNALNVRIGAGTSNDKLVFNNKTITLSSGTKVNVYEEHKVGSVTWYLVTFSYNGVTLAGYVSGDYIILDNASGSGENGNTDNNENPGENNNSGDNDNSNGSGSVVSDEEFEAKLTKEGFPESYKVLLRQLHKQYPYWEFKAYNTGLDWNTVITKESKVGVNLITNSKNIGWKSLETGAYNWKTDKFVAYDGSTWVTASKAAIEYYMDPRNFLTANKIFQFEALSYQSDYQTQKGVESILLNTPLYNTSYAYTDSDTGEEKNYTYSDTFIKAAEYSGVSPFHLATRVKQEVVTSKATLSSSVTGTVSGYEGYYNFYNIGATHSTVAGGAVANGLNYAKNGSSNATTNGTYLIPWDNQFDAIVGGAKFIGSSYIDRGQNTIYLQKFNVTPTSTYSHQYMANVEAASAEATKTYTAYSSMTDTPIVFMIPIYNNMPTSACPVPADVLNPNNWLSNLSIDGYSLTPTFDLSKDQVYNLIVDNSVSTITVSATAVSKKATVSGAGTISLNVGQNTVTVQVTAENGDIRQYIINVVREN